MANLYVQKSPIRPLTPNLFPRKQPPSEQREPVKSRRLSTHNSNVFIGSVFGNLYDKRS